MPMFSSKVGGLGDSTLMLLTHMLGLDQAPQQAEAQAGTGMPAPTPQPTASPTAGVYPMEGMSADELMKQMKAWGMQPNATPTAQPTATPQPSVLEGLLQRLGAQGR